MKAAADEYRAAARGAGGIDGSGIEQSDAIGRQRDAAALAAAARSAQLRIAEKRQRGRIERRVRWRLTAALDDDVASARAARDIEERALQRNVVACAERDGAAVAAGRTRSRSAARDGDVLRGDECHAAAVRTRSVEFAGGGLKELARLEHDATALGGHPGRFQGP